ncbi:MAG: hypothetical protein JSR73_15260 [Proteobacteria bacterium]|nr:hypothetical protein [Pseudomonadota bacterium]
MTAAPPSGEEAPSAAGATAEHEREAEVPATAPVEAEPPPEWNRPRPPLQGIDAQLHRLAVDLRLDEGQQQKIRPILVAQRDEAQRLQRDPQLKAPERHARLLALGDRTADQIRAQLTDEQRAQYVKPRSRSAVSGKAHAVRRPPAAAAAGATAGKDPK